MPRPICKISWQRSLCLFVHLPFLLFIKLCPWVCLPGEQTDRVAPFLSSRAALVPKVPAGVVVLASLPLVCVLGERFVFVFLFWVGEWIHAAVAVSSHRAILLCFALCSHG